MTAPARRPPSPFPKPRAGLAPPGPWYQRGRCATHPAPDIWFPDDADHATAARAAEVCATCPVAADCLAHALATREPHGVWGGLTGPQRQGLLRRRSRAA